MLDATIDSCSSAPCRSPAVSAEPTGPTAANVTITPPAGGPWARYNVTTCPAAGPISECVNTTCTTITNCPVTGLDPSTTYVTIVSGKCCLA